MALKTLKALVGEAGAGLDSSQGFDTLQEVLEALITQVEDLRAKFNLHTHAADGSEVGAYNTSKVQSDTETIAQNTAISVTQLVDTE